MAHQLFEGCEIHSDHGGTRAERKFRGVRQRVGLKDRFNADVFQALETAVYDAFFSEEPGRTDAELGVFRSRSAAALVNVDPTQPVLTTHENGAVVVRSAGPDGSLLGVRVSPP
jgi:hypothetical protein